MSEVTIVTPRRAKKRGLEGGLVALTETIAKADASLVASGFLGGEFGYGAQYEPRPAAGAEMDTLPSVSIGTVKDCGER